MIDATKDPRRKPLAVAVWRCECQSRIETSIITEKTLAFYKAKLVEKVTRPTFMINHRGHKMTLESIVPPSESMFYTNRG